MKPHRVPYVLGGSTSTSGNVARIAEQTFRNDTRYPMEVYGVGFSLANAASSAADQSYDQIGIALEMPLPQASAGCKIEAQSWQRAGFYPRIATLIDLVGNRPTGADLFAFNGARWRFRDPFLLPSKSAAQATLRNTTGVTATIDVVLLGALLVPPTADPRLFDLEKFSDGASAWTGLLPPDLEIRPAPFGRTPDPRWSRALLQGPNRVDQILAYARHPYVLGGQLTLSAAGTMLFDDAGFRNETKYTFHAHEVGIALEEALDQYPAQNLRDIFIRIMDLTTGQDWMKTHQRASALVPLAGSRMEIGQGSVWMGTKMLLGPGTILPSGGGLQAEAYRDPAVSMTLHLSIIGSLLVPIMGGTAHANVLRDHISAVPSWG
jgi:hypothetical protein